MFPFAINDALAAHARNSGRLFHLCKVPDQRRRAFLRPACERWASCGEAALSHPVQQLVGVESRARNIALRQHAPAAIPFLNDEVGEVDFLEHIADAPLRHSVAVGQAIADHMGDHRRAVGRPFA